MKRIVKNKQAFTLLEILLVIAAIGILASIVIVAINPQRQLAAVRNAERKTHLTTLNAALQQYLIEHRMYPATVQDMDDFEILEICMNLSDECSTDQISLAESLVPTYIAAIPQDSSSTTGSGYYLQKLPDSIALHSPYYTGQEFLTFGAFQPVPQGKISWLRGEEEVQFIEEDQVLIWNDLSGNNNIFWANTSTRRPTKGVFQGKSAVQFTHESPNIGQHLTSPILPNLTYGEEKHYYVFEVGEYQTYAGDINNPWPRLGWLSSDGIGNHAIFSFGSTHRQRAMTVRFNPLGASSGGFGGSPGLQNLLEPTIISYRVSYDGERTVTGDYSIYNYEDRDFERSTEGSYTSPDTFTGTIQGSRLVIGARNINNDNYVSKTVAEVIIYARDTPLLSQEIESIEKYLTLRYGIH